jgi:hypothetical protein
MDAEEPDAKEPDAQVPDAGAGAGLDALTENRSGRATALTTISALPRFWSPAVKLVLRIKSCLGPDKTLRRLSFIHVAHWVMIDHFPGETRRAKYSYLLFVSNFNGSWLDYIDTFSTAVAPKMNLIWGSSYGFPGARPPRPFTDMIRANDRDLQHYYSAYPGATTTEVASAMRVQERLASVRHAVHLGDTDLVRTWRAFLNDVQRDL